LGVCGTVRASEFDCGAKGPKVLLHLCVDAHYDDGGLSGASLNRPALQALLAGSFIQTLTMVDVATGWTECLPLVTRDGSLVVAACSAM
jgi:hypothetical protein